MKLPVGMLVIWAKRFNENFAVINGAWYYKEHYVPASLEEKLKVTEDLKQKRCTVISIAGTYDQILDLLMQTDRFNRDGDFDDEGFKMLQNELLKDSDKAYIFEDVFNLAGNSLMLDTVVEIDETMDEVLSAIKSNKAVMVKISEGWSFANEFMAGF